MYVNYQEYQQNFELSEALFVSSSILTLAQWQQVELRTQCVTIIKLAEPSSVLDMLLNS